VTSQYNLNQHQSFIFMTKRALRLMAWRVNPGSLGARFFLYELCLTLCSIFFWTLSHQQIAHSAVLDPPLTQKLAVSSDEIISESLPLIHREAPSILLAQANSQPQSSTQTWTDEDTSNILTGLIVVLILPLFWGPTRKAVGLLNIIVGTILTITGIGAVFGIPMILVGGVCLFI